MNIPPSINACFGILGFSHEGTTKYLIVKNYSIFSVYQKITTGGRIFRPFSIRLTVGSGGSKRIKFFLTSVMYLQQRLAALQILERYYPSASQFQVTAYSSFTNESFKIQCNKDSVF